MGLYCHLDLVKQVEEEGPLLGEVPAACERKAPNCSCRNCDKTPDKYAERGRTRGTNGPDGQHIHAKWWLIRYDAAKVILTFYIYVLKTSTMSHIGRGWYGGC